MKADAETCNLNLLSHALDESAQVKEKKGLQYSLLVGIELPFVRLLPVGKACSTEVLLNKTSVSVCRTQIQFVSPDRLLLMFLSRDLCLHEKPEIPYVYTFSSDGLRPYAHVSTTPADFVSRLT